MNNFSVDDLEDLGRAVENALGCTPLYGREIQEKFEEMGVTDEGEALEILEKLSMVTVSNNEPGCLPDGDPYVLFVGLKGKEDMSRIRNVVAEDLENYYEGTKYEDEADKLAGELRQVADDFFQKALTVYGPDGRVFGAVLGTAAEQCFEMQILKNTEEAQSVSPS